MNVDDRAATASLNTALKAVQRHFAQLGAVSSLNTKRAKTSNGRGEPYQEKGTLDYPHGREAEGDRKMYHKKHRCKNCEG